MSARFVALILCSAATLIINALLIIPARATGPEGPTTFSGSTAGAVAYSSNSSTGSAIEGVTGTVAGGKGVWGVANNALNAGTGVRATAFGPSSFGLFGEATNTNKSKPSYGLYATSKSSYAVYAFTNVPGLTSLLAYNSDATSNGSHAIRAQSRGDAITGVSTGNNGVVGQVSATPTPMPSAAFALAGVLGRDTAASSHNAGVAGTSANGIGVVGASTIYFGVYGTSTNNAGVFGSSGNNIGVVGWSHSTFAPGVQARNFTDSTAALEVVAGSGTATPSSSVSVMTVFFGPAQSCGGISVNDIFTIDQKGDVKACGTITASTTPLVIRRTTLGQHLVSYAAQQSQPTIEDFGQGRLVNGQAYVAIEPRFATTIDSRATYLVFLTPRGDTNGLYIARATPAGFSVRENRGGRSTIAFDYRIVAKPYDTNAPRLPLASSLPHPRPVALPPAILGRPQFQTVPRLRG